MESAAYRILQALGVDYSVLHLNEGHPAFAILERIREKVESGMTYSDAFEEVRKHHGLYHPYASPGRP